MAIKLSGNLSMLNDIVAEFGGSEPHKISDYYSDGTLPTTGYITFSDFYGQGSSATINITISSNTNNYNLWNSKGGTYSAGNTTINVTINSGVTIGSTSTGTYAFDTGTGWSSGDVINITNNGTIKGRGGNGGNGGNVSGFTVYPGSNGATGGPAFRGQFACTVTNNGSVYGGGGGGGGGGGDHSSELILKNNTVENTGRTGGGGGGGAGVNSGSGGSRGPSSSGNDFNNLGTNGSNGTATAGGAGGTNAGNGGGLGANGAAGQPAFSQTLGFRAAGGSGGVRGYYQVGSSLINGGSGISGTVGGRSA